MNLGLYLERIGFDGNAIPSAESLSALLRCHILSVPFENLDVQLGIPVTTAIQPAFDKIVRRGRGGWCYEQNGLFGWALTEIGFDVTRVAAAVRRDERDINALANHLCLLVRIPDDPRTVYLADVGFGGSMIAPIPLRASEYRQAPFGISLHQLDDGYWRFNEVSATDAVSYDFLAEPGDESAMSEKCTQLQTVPESSFVLNFVAQQRMPEAHISLRGRVLRKTAASGQETRTLQSSSEFSDVLRTVFKLDVPASADLWPAIVERHSFLFDKR